MVADEWFLDSSYAIALAASSDQLHDRAIELADEIERQARGIVTTRGVLLEVGNALAKVRYRTAAVQLLDSLEMDPAVEILSLSDDLYMQALNLFRTRLDKQWGITDCVSFLVMESRGLSEALTFDEHFEQAGFRALLR